MDDDGWSECDDELFVDIITDNAEPLLSQNTGGGDDEGFDAAVQESVNQHSLRALKVSLHNKRLDRHLKNNGMNRLTVYGDGNCFFKAASFHFIEQDETSLRAVLCDHLRENMDHYINFLKDTTTEEALKQIDAMEKSGVWNTDINDIMPLALANFSKRKLKIFSSRRDMSVVDLSPTLPNICVDSYMPIYLALLAPEHEPQHFDGCLSKERHLYYKFSRTSHQSAGSNTSSRSSAEPDAAPASPSSSAELDVTPASQSSSAELDVTPASQSSSAELDVTPASQSSSAELDVTLASQSSSAELDVTPASQSSTAELDVTPASQSSSAELDVTPASPSSSAELDVTPASQSSSAELDVTPASPSSSAELDVTPPSPMDTREPLTSSTIYNTPTKKPGRKRKSKPETWKRNQQKMAKLEGKGYVSSRGKVMESKGVKYVDCSKCKLKCSSRINIEQQRVVFDTFYGLHDYHRQKDYICTHVTENKTATILDEGTMTPKNKRRQVTRKFFLTIDGKKVQVCKRVFTGTLSVGHAYIRHALANVTDGLFTGQDRRGRHTPGNKTDEEERGRVKKHIESFPCLESHYCRQSTGRKFLDETLSIMEMYRLYTRECATEGVVPVSKVVYRQVFVSEYNLSFHKPKKDLCLLCSLYRDAQKTNTLTPEQESEYSNHQEKKRESREEKANDKKLAQENKDMSVVTFDLESVLSTPCNNISQTHYKRKLAVYNLSVYNLSSKDGQCFVWDETHGRKGSCEIATCLYHHLKCLPPQVKHVVLYSDTCTGQNRNKYVAAALLHAVQTLPNLECIDQKFLTSGHTHMECDSMHAAIEMAKRKIHVAVPDQWHYVMECARLKQPYTIHELEFGDFIDYKSVAAQTLRNTKTDAAGNRINWLNLTWLRFTKKDPDTIQFKYRMKEDFKLMKIRGSRRGRTPGSSIGRTALPKRYLERQPIPAVKKNDLLDLCRLGIIPPKHHPFYEGLPCSSAAPDRLPQPDATEYDETDED